jgi:hypothetical protein
MYHYDRDATQEELTEDGRLPYTVYQYCFGEAQKLKQLAG